jgi:hypothetical protein
MYKSLNKEQRDKVQLMAAEKKIRAEVEELKLQLKKVQVRALYKQCFIAVGLEQDIQLC